MKIAIDLRRPNLHEHVSTMEGSAHLLLLDGVRTRTAPGDTLRAEQNLNASAGGVRANFRASESLPSAKVLSISGSESMGKRLQSAL
ncbi:hypothetical protein [Mesorhizobium sp.]|uniref:hypothetical protein n=1 Tax=Mesorhizobium sp. TaxID=1871066 RepID=UPI000FE3E963|nr:hypothetical protein [Mesorhizobium sp.]RWN59390.1 MAG: hypothetical protein EOR98_03175 [Mesorhizobium sp.]RWN80895.1 MAG: hypothetical protein EOS02_03165 [Mesorhizobium sp.]RWN83318.1 MAG: hypothetical protein EOS01_03175 [Mesorhizobium sp.]RWN86756.1 MAG: hypothetical protein EOS04_17815 [Mesorhizobium sp.]RWO16391.1 MAG: hypothetical protein EOS15_05210 [Mesorhizobium sp.]